MNQKNNIAVIIPAAGSSTRFEGKISKQFFKIGNETVIEKSVNKFLEIDSFKKVYVSIDKDESLIKSQSFFNHPKVVITDGGCTRSESVYNAVLAIEDDIDVVVIHDAARPWVSKKLISELLSEYKKDKSIQGLYPVISVIDSLRMKKDKNLNPVDRDDFFAIQTPQIFHKESLKKALNKMIEENLSFTDESQAMERAGFTVREIIGERSNIKITYLDDIPVNVDNDYRIGRGVDFHKFEPGKGITLGNVFIDCNLSIIAHSDGDIVLHAISDALLGAGGLKDIGYYFPDTDSKNLNISSVKILEESLALLKKKSLQPRNIDFVVVCEQPKIQPYVDDLKKSLSSILNIGEDFVGVKATTAEGMGIIGAGNGIAVFAIASLEGIK
tara:strand:- start:1947 stop:3101 length:1155 start_codon:yes stop_codon:yes gene_type:complete